MQTYIDLLQRILSTGEKREDRTGTGTLSIFGTQMHFDLSKGFPLLTTKKIHLKSVIAELIWMLSGSTNVKPLQAQGVRIWDEWTNEYGELGPVYGAMWRGMPGTPYAGGHGNIDRDTIDQMAEVVQSIQKNPFSRRHIVTAWHPETVDQCRLPPCHCFIQFYVSQADITRPRLSCHLYQRSGDMFLGVPFNIASYALLTMMIAQVTGLAPGEFIHTMGDAHLYLNHIEQARVQLARDPRPAPTMKINPDRKSLFDFVYEDFTLENYDPYPAIKAQVAV